MRLSGEVYEFLLGRLMSLEIEPGERIGVDALARQLEVSQTPIREALIRLEDQGLVVKLHLSGYRAAEQLTRRQFDDMCELRLLIEPAAASKAAWLMPEAEIEALGALAAAMAEPSSPTGQAAYTRFAEQDAMFHARITEAAGNELLMGILSRQTVHLRLFRLRRLAAVTQDALVEHARILKAFMARDAAGAEAAMRAHLESARDRFRKVFDA